MITEKNHYKINRDKIQSFFKKIEDKNWKVPVRIEYKTAENIQENRQPKVYERTVVFPNTKIAEEEAYMEAIIEMYQQNPDLF